MERKPLKRILTCFPDGKSKVLTLSFDDGSKEDLRLVELLNRYDLRATFNLNSGEAGEGPRLPLSAFKELYRGHEIACHTVLHPTLARCPIEQIVQQILDDRRALETVTDRPVLGFAYPNGSVTQQIQQLLPTLGIHYARTIHSTHTFDMPEDYLAWNPTCHFREDLQKTAETFCNLHRPHVLQLLYVWGHSFELERDDGWALIESFCKLVTKRSDIWYATNMEIVNYMAHAALLQFTAAGDRVYNPSAQSVWLSVEGAPIEIPGGKTVALF